MTASLEQAEGKRLQEVVEQVQENGGHRTTHLSLAEFRLCEDEDHEGRTVASWGAAMSSDAVDRLRAAASPDDYTSMARLARALYEIGLCPRDVLRECYGVTFPEELFVIADGGGLKQLGQTISCTYQPWKLAVPPDRGSPAAMPNSMADIELRLRAVDPDLMPLAVIPPAVFGAHQWFVCYRLSALRAGRSTVFRLFGTSDPGAALACGDSLLELLHREHAKVVHQLEKELRKPYNWGAGSVDDEDVERAYESLERIEELQRQASERQNARLRVTVRHAEAAGA
ncbi:hypothetical protein AB0I81_17580 [Nonomuraea sp. NPDC050404]|uniref:hypothetical protein n=1 Tax=Nonomuraea sp. NPDC050404 TaxID=3155783 RepID=UPI0033F782D5